MPYMFEYDATHGVLAARYSGVLTDDELTTCFLETPRHVARLHHVRAGIIDLRDADMRRISAATVRRLAATPPNFPEDVARVLIAPNNHEFGFSRMFEGLSGDRRSLLRVFRTEEEALRYLAITTDLHFVPLPPLEQNE